MSDLGLCEERIFTTALALPASERDNYLRRACADASVFARLHALFDAHEIGNEVQSRVFPRPFVGGGDIEVENYRLFEEIGEGGWGVVYRAEQVVPLRREVALKIIKVGMDTRALIQRFEAERQALAIMDHSNIAKVFDAGSTPTGRPYFAMELVRGIKITDYCDLTMASITDRLELIVQVCRAIEHAHRKGIVHRDVKPSNVMVTLCDGLPVVKVIDFGVAKAIQGRLTDSTLLTAVDTFVGTPAYVSPEQTECAGARVDARSDIYSLGVLLYELVCGSTPFNSNDASSSRHNALRARVRAEEPISPSKRISGLATDASANLSRCMRTARTRLIRQLQGDLDWVIMRCLEKEPSRRYQSVHELSLDLHRYLRDEPVIARPHRLAHSVRKFAKRHRAAFAAGSATVAMLLATTVVTTWLAVRAVRANQLAQTVTNFLQDDLLLQDLSAYQGYLPDDDSVTMLTVLDHAADRVGARFSDEPLVEAAIRSRFGTAYHSLGANQRARVQFEAARKIYEEEYGVRDRRTLAAMAKEVSSLAKLGSYDDAERLGVRALLHSEKVLGRSDVETLSLSTTMAFVWLEKGDIEKSRDLNWTVDTQRTVLGDTHVVTLQSYLILAAIAAEDGLFPEAERYARLALGGRARVLGPWHPDTSEAADALQAIHTRSGKCGSPEEVAEATDARYAGWQRRHPGAQEQLMEHVVVVGRALRSPYRLRGLRPTYRACLPGEV